MTHLVADTTGIYLNATSSITTNKITSLRTIRLTYEGVGSVVITTSSVSGTKRRIVPISVLDILNQSQRLL